MFLLLFFFSTISAGHESTSSRKSGLAEEDDFIGLRLSSCSAYYALPPSLKGVNHRYSLSILLCIVNWPGQFVLANPLHPYAPSPSAPRALYRARAGGKSKVPIEPWAKMGFDMQLYIYIYIYIYITISLVCYGFAPRGQTKPQHIKYVYTRE